MYKRFRRILAGIGGLVLAVGTPMMATPAHAAAPSISCSGPMTQTWDPGLLLLIVRPVHYTAQIDYTCTSSDSTIHSGQINVDATYANSCAVNSGAVVATITWNGGGKGAPRSTLSLPIATGVNVLGALQAYLATGTVTDGVSAGSTATMLNAFTGQVGTCLSLSGLTSLTGTSTLTIL